jgi:hypothetical protein
MTVTRNVGVGLICSTSTLVWELVCAATGKLSATAAANNNFVFTNLSLGQISASV